MANKITEEEMKRLSKLKTEEELIKLGTSMAEDKFESRVEEMELRSIENEISRICNELPSVTKKQIVETYTSYLELQKKKYERRDKEYKKLKIEYDDLLEDNKSTILELDQIEKEKDARILKLRSKCIEKNRKNQILSIIIFISSILSFYIGYLGIFTFVNNIFTGLSHVFSYTFGVIYCICNTLSIICYAIRNNHYYTQYIMVGILLYYHTYPMKIKIS